MEPLLIPDTKHTTFYGVISDVYGDDVVSIRVESWRLRSFEVSKRLGLAILVGFVDANGVARRDYVQANKVVWEGSFQ